MSLKPSLRSAVVAVADPWWKPISLIFCSSCDYPCTQKHRSTKTYNNTLVIMFTAGPEEWQWTSLTIQPFLGSSACKHALHIGNIVHFLCMGLFLESFRVCASTGVPKIKSLFQQDYHTVHDPLQHVTNTSYYYITWTVLFPLFSLTTIVAFSPSPHCNRPCPECIYYLQWSRYKIDVPATNDLNCEYIRKTMRQK